MKHLWRKRLMKISFLVEYGKWHKLETASANFFPKVKKIRSWISLYCPFEGNAFFILNLSNCLAHMNYRTKTLDNILKLKNETRSDSSNNVKFLLVSYSAHSFIFAYIWKSKNYFYSCKKQGGEFHGTPLIFLYHLEMKWLWKLC